MSDYRARLEAHRVQELPKRIRAFEACKTPTAEVKCDANLFLRKYFLDEDGNPDRTKTPDLILLPGYTDRSLALTARTERVPGLHVADAGFGSKKNIMVIGWDRIEVVEKATEIDMQQSHGRGVVRHDWDRLMEAHYAHAFRIRVQNEKIRNSDKAALESRIHDRLEPKGVFILRSDRIEDVWAPLSKQMRLRMVHPGRLGVFDFGIVCGLMVFGRTQLDILKILKKGAWNRGSDDFPEYSDAENSESEDEYIDGEGGKSAVSDEPNSSSRSGSGKPAKRRKVEKGNPRRVYFRWRGYDTLSGILQMVQMDPGNSQTGYMDFMNDDATSFEGSIYMGIAGGTISFQGYQIPGMSEPLTMNWDALSIREVERARAPKWKL